MFDLFKKTPAETAAAPKASWTERLKAGLGLSREKLSTALTEAFSLRVLDEETEKKLENALLAADVGTDATQHLIADMWTRWRANAKADPRNVLADAMIDLITPLEKPLIVDARRPFVIMLTGVNGAGKTTSIGKLAKWLQAQDLSVLLAAGDTFRAAAREQLTVWGERNGVAVIQQAGGDPAAVMFDAVSAARARGIDVVLADTAGRLPTQAHLMEELRKVKRVLGKAEEGAPHEVLLVLDATVGQNGLNQAREFMGVAGVNGIVLTKLDGTAKGGIAVAIAHDLKLPIRYVGVGEAIDDLIPFSPEEYVNALFEEKW
jgi:fused signal recognition particle receptor